MKSEKFAKFSFIFKLRDSFLVNRQYIRKGNISQNRGVTKKTTLMIRPEILIFNSNHN